MGSRPRTPAASGRSPDKSGRGTFDLSGRIGSATARCVAPGCVAQALIGPRARLLGAGRDGALCPEHRAAQLGLVDRELACRTPACAERRTWTAAEQLAAALPEGWYPGVRPEPLRTPDFLCRTCRRAGPESAERAPRGSQGSGGSRGPREGGRVQVMPCVVLGCRGTWMWSPGAVVAPAEEGSAPVDRMCAACAARHRRDAS